MQFLYERLGEINMLNIIITILFIIGCISATAMMIAMTIEIINDIKRGKK